MATIHTKYKIRSRQNLTSSEKCFVKHFEIWIVSLTHLYKQLEETVKRNNS